MKDALIVAFMVIVLGMGTVLYFDIGRRETLELQVKSLEKRMGQVAWSSGEADKKVKRHFLFHLREISGMSKLKGRVGSLEYNQKHLLKKMDELGNWHNQELD